MYTIMLLYILIQRFTIEQEKVKEEVFDVCSSLNKMDNDSKLKLGFTLQSRNNQGTFRAMLKVVSLGFVRAFKQRNYTCKIAYL